MTPNTPTRASAPPPPRNGNGNNLPEHRQKTVEAGLATYQQVLAERDELEKQLHEANLKNEALTVQLNSLKGVVSMMENSYLQTKMEGENRIATYQAERDEAVRSAAALQTVLGNIYVILRNYVNEPDKDDALPPQIS